MAGIDFAGDIGKAGSHSPASTGFKDSNRGGGDAVKFAGDNDKFSTHSASKATGDAAAKGDPSNAKGMSMGGEDVIDTPVDVPAK